MKYLVYVSMRDFVLDHMGGNILKYIKSISVVDCIL